MGEEEIIKKRKQKIINWLKDPYNLSLVGILLFAFVIRLYYFILVKNQPLWWDEAAYGSLAKNLAYHLWDGTTMIVGETAIRPIMLPLIWSFLIRIGVLEGGVRFLLEFLPSIITVFFVYLIGKEMYNKKIGLIASAIFSVLWIHLFYTVRLLTNVPALVFLFPSIYLFIRACKGKFNPKYFILSLILLLISTLFRYPNGMFLFVYAIMFIFYKKLYLLKKVRFWIYSLIGASPLLLFFIINFFKFGNIFPALLGGDYLEPVVSPPAYWILNYISVYLNKIFFIFFLLGLLIVLFELIIGYNFIFKSNKLKNHLFLLLILIVINSFFIFYLRGGEDRYLFPTSISMVCFTAIGINFLSNMIKKYNKIFAAIAIFTILIFGAYAQITFADEIITQKKASYLEVRQGFEWIKANTPEDAIVMGSGIDPYAVYYAERTTYPLNETREGFEQQIQEINPDLLVLHAFAPQRDYINQYIIDNPDKWEAINAYFFDPQQTQPALIIYKKL